MAVEVPVNTATLVQCVGCGARMGNVMATLTGHDQSCTFHDVTGCTHGGYCYQGVA